MRLGRRNGSRGRLRGAGTRAGGFFSRVAGGIGSVFTSVRYFLGDLLYVISRLPVAIFRGVREFWKSLPRVTRNRLTVAVGTAVVAIFLLAVVVPNLPCSFPGGDECPPDDDAIALVPSEALGYAHANLDPDTEQYEAAIEIAGRMPLVARQVAGRLLPLLIGSAGRPSDFGTEIEPWFGGEIAVASTATPGGGSNQVQLIEADDVEGAQAYAESIAAGTATTEKYRDVDVSEDARGLTTAVVDDFLVLGSNSGVRGVIDVATGADGASSLGDDPVAEEALDLLPDSRVAEAYISEDGIPTLVGDATGTLATVEPFVDAGASEGAALSISADDDGIDLATRSVLDPDRVKSNPGFFAAFEPFDPQLPEDLDPDTITYLGLGEPRKTLGELLAQAAAGAPAIASGFTDLVEGLRDAAGVDLEEDLLPTLRGEAAFAVVPRDADEEEEPQGSLPGQAPPDTLGPGATATPYLELLADDVDPEKAREALARLQGPIAEELFDPELGSPSFDQIEVGGVNAQVLQISPTAELVYAVIDSLLVVATDPAGVEQAASDDGDGLAGSDRYEDATEDLPDEPSLIAYADLSNLLRFFERIGLAEDPSYTPFAGDLRQLDTIALAVESGDDELSSDARLVVSEPESDDADEGSD